MAKRSKHTGLAAKAKKQKKNVEPPSNEIRIELNETVDAEDEFAQLQALWKTYVSLEKETPAVINGVIHECDRLLRNSESVPASFHATYGLALAELAKFHTQENEEGSVQEYFDAALERLDSGLESHPDSSEIKFAKARVLIDRLPLQYISQIEDDGSNADEFPALDVLLDNALELYEAAETGAETELFNLETLEILQAFDDLLDMVDNFGKDEEEEEKEEKEEDEEKDEEEEDDDENDGDEEEEDHDEDDDVTLPENHPLYIIKTSDKYNQWWRDHTEAFLKRVNARGDSTEVKELRRELNKRLGQSYLQESEVPTSVYTALTYDDDYAGIEELEGLSREDAQSIAQKILTQAVAHFEAARDPEDPETWVPIAEAKISLGNMYELESEQQEQYYQEAEKILIKANRATNGQFQDALDNLQQIEKLE